MSDAAKYMTGKCLPCHCVPRPMGIYLTDQKAKVLWDGLSPGRCVWARINEEERRDETSKFVFITLQCAHFTLSSKTKRNFKNFLLPYFSTIFSFFFSFYNALMVFVDNNRSIFFTSYILEGAIKKFRSSKASSFVC